MIAVFFTILFVVSLVVVGVLIKLATKPKNREYYSSSSDYGFAAALVGVFVCFPLFLVAFLPTSIAYVSQVSDQESLVQLQQQQAVYTRKATNLTAEFKSYLAVKYPDYEKSVIGGISRKNVGSIITLYPNLRTADTIMLLVNQIRDLNNSIYEQEIDAAKIAKDIRTRKRNPFYFPGVF